MNKINTWRHPDNDNAEKKDLPKKYQIVVSEKLFKKQKTQKKKTKTQKLSEELPKNKLEFLKKPTSVLQRYYQAGWLDFGNKRYTGEDRLNVGERLARDYYLSHFSDVKSLDLTQEVRGGVFLLDNVLDSRHRYNQAMRAIPHEFWPLIRKVCIEDEELFDNDNFQESKRQKLYASYLAKVDLSRGLDRLIEHYLHHKNTCQEDVP